MINRKIFFDEVRRRLFPSGMTQAQVNAFNAALDKAETTPVVVPPPPDIPKPAPPPPAREKTFGEKFADLFRAPKG